MANITVPIQVNLPDDWIEQIVNRLRNDPESEWVEIVRCKDCKHYVTHTLFGRSQGWCERLCDEFDRSLARGTVADDFCSRGERITDG